MFSHNATTKSYENGASPSTGTDMSTRQDRLNLQIPSVTPTRNTIRTSPNAHVTQQQNIHPKHDKNYANVFNFTDDCNFQGKLG